MFKILLKISKTTRIILIVISLCIVLISIPIILFVFHFKNQFISSNIEKWAYFGEYFGGILSPIISLLSLIIIGYLTYIVSKYSNDENKNLHYLKLKLDAYDELSKQIPILSIIGIESLNIMKSFNYNLKNHKENNFEFLDQTKSDLRKNNSLVLQFSSFLFNFNVRYSHLFKYDFNSKDYQESVKCANKLREEFQLIYDKIELQNNTVNINMAETIDNLITNLAKFLNDIRKELN